MTTSTLTVTDFVLARIAEDESRNAHLIGCPYGLSGGVDDCECGEGSRNRTRRAAMRKIVELHASWPVLAQTPPEFTRDDDGDPSSMTMRMTRQIAWTTEQEYRNRFGEEPPTAPMIRALASIWSDHPDFNPDWS